MDSNYWVYYFNKSTPEHKHVIKPIETALDSKDIVINTIIVMEVAHFLVKVLGPKEGKKKIDIFMAYPLKILDFDLETQRIAIELLCECSHLGVGARDAAIMAMMKRKGIKTIMTHDAAIKKVGFVKVVDSIPR